MTTQREVQFSIEQWELESPFRITGHVFHIIDILHVSITENGTEGRGILNVDGPGEAGCFHLARDPPSRRGPLNRLNVFLRETFFDICLK